MKTLLSIPFVAVLAILGAIAFVVLILSLIVLAPIINIVETTSLNKSYGHH